MGTLCDAKVKNFTIIIVQSYMSMELVEHKIKDENSLTYNIFEKS